MSLNHYKNTNYFKEYYVVDASRLTHVKRNNNFKKYIVPVSLSLLIIVLCVFSFIGISHYMVYTPKEDVVEKPSVSFPITLTYEKKLNLIDINKILKDCSSGSFSYSSILNTQISTLASVQNSTNLSSFGSAKSEEADLSKLRISLNNLQKKENCNISFIMYDLNSNSGIAYNPDWQTPSASAIKLPYIASMLETSPNLFNVEKDNIVQTLKYSDGDSYVILRNRYGTNNLKNWCKTLGIANDLIYAEYPDITSARDIMRLWFKTFYFMKTVSYSEELCNLTIDSRLSAIYYALGQKYIVNSKPGWWDSGAQTDQGVYYNGITCDGGVIYSSNNPYLLVIYSDLCQEPEKLKEIIQNIDMCHDSMYRKVIVCYNEEEYEAVQEEMEE